MAKTTKVRAIVRIVGVTNQTVYGTKLETVRRRALLLLLEHPVGYANTEPVNVETQEQASDGSYQRVELIEHFDGMALCDKCRWAKWPKGLRLFGECTAQFPPTCVPASVRVSQERQPIWSGRVVTCKFFQHETQTSKP